VLELGCGSAGVVSGLPAEAQLQLQHTAIQERNRQCGSSTTQSQTPEYEHINARNILSI